MPGQRSRALIADGDSQTRIAVSRHLSSEGFDIAECSDGREALECLTTSPFDLIVLDAELSGLDGIALCRVVRQGSVNRHSAVFVIAGSSAESEKVLAFANGADECMSKPLSIREFLARASAVLRRAHRTPERSANRAIDRSGIRLDPAKRQVIVRGRQVVCSKQEFDLLYALMASPGVVFSREELLARCWPAYAKATVGQRDASVRLVDPIVSRLRRKIEHEPDVPHLIVTVWGIGYKFTESEI